MPTEFIPNPFLEAEVLRSAEMNHVIEDKANKVVEAARSLVPVETGTLQQSISEKMTGASEAQVTANTDYAAFVEFGTSIMGAQPYLRPALDTLAGT